MCGIFAYLNFCTPKKRHEIIEILLQGLRRMEYRGYDSAGIAIDSSNDPKHQFDEISVLRKVGKVDALDAYIHERDDLDNNMVYQFHCGIAHTRWATHGSPNDVNSHPQRSSNTNDFVVVHNGIITNYREIKEYLQKKGYSFESETDTEVIAKLIHHIHERYPQFGFRQLVKTTIQQLEGAFALALKSRIFPNQLVATRRARNVLSSYCGEESFCDSPIGCEIFNMSVTSLAASPARYDKNVFREGTRSVRLFDTLKNFEAEYFFASDASVEHTKLVLFLEDDDVAVFDSGLLSIHRIKRHDDPTSQTRKVQQLNMELQQIMRGDFKIFMQKEIFEQPESVINTMRGRVLSDGWSSCFGWN